MYNNMACRPGAKCTFGGTSTAANRYARANPSEKNPSAARGRAQILFRPELSKCFYLTENPFMYMYVQ